MITFALIESASLLFAASVGTADILNHAKKRHPHLEFQLAEDGRSVMVCAIGTSFKKGYEVLGLESFGPFESESIQAESTDLAAGVVTAAMTYETEARRDREENIRKYGMPFIVEIPLEWRKIEVEEKVRTPEEQNALDLALLAILQPWDYQKLREAVLLPQGEAQERRITDDFLRPDMRKEKEIEPSR